RPRARPVLPAKEEAAPPPPEAFPPEPVAEKEPEAWIEVQVVDQDGVPWGARDYKLQLPDLNVVDGQLDADGRVRREPLKPGLAKLWLPEEEGVYDQRLVDAASAAAT